MKDNIVLADRTIRIGAGMLLLASPLLEMSTYPFNLLGLILIGTAAAGYCPIYGLLGAFKPTAGRRPDDGMHGAAHRT
jgi:hypothetical protein